MTEKANIKIFWNRIPPNFDSVLVLLRHRQNYVFVKNKNRSWEFPGGHREGGESAFETAHREVFEETGVTGQNFAFHGYYILPGGHITVIASAMITEIPDVRNLTSETIDIIISPILPPKLSFDDRLYEALLSRLFPGETAYA